MEMCKGYASPNPNLGLCTKFLQLHNNLQVLEKNMYTLQTKTTCGAIQPQFFKQIFWCIVAQVASKTTITPKKPKAHEDIK
jgi:hypothetical protein